MVKKQGHPTIWIASSGLLVAAVLALSIVPQSMAQGTSATQDQALARFEQVYRFVLRNYVDEVDPDALIEGALTGLLESLDDPHTTYLDTEAMRALTDTTSGEFGGVGMYIAKPAGESEDATHIEVISPIEGTPADRAGLRAGDIIVRVDGTSTLGLSSDDVVDMLRGRPGSDVEIRIRRSAQVEFDIVLERAIIRVPTVRWDMIDDQIAFLRIVQFTPYTDDSVKDALETFEAAGYSSMIIDLRSNPGGLLDGVVDVADLFFDDGLIVETRGRVPSENQQFFAGDGHQVPRSVDVVVLVDGGSASAAEILAAVMQDRDRALVLGQTTYGKGSVQQVRSLGTSGFRITMSRYYTPRGTSIDLVGVEPDVVVVETDLTEDEEAGVARILSENRVGDFVSRVGEPSELQVDSFLRELRSDGITVDDRYVRRLVRVEANRAAGRDQIYDLDFDLMLQAAVEELRSR